MGAQCKDVQQAVYFCAALHLLTMATVAEPVADEPVNDAFFYKGRQYENIEEARQDTLTVRMTRAMEAKQLLGKYVQVPHQDILPEQLDKAYITRSDGCGALRTKA